MPQFDPSFVTLATAVSIEAICRSTFVLISQNRTRQRRTGACGFMTQPRDVIVVGASLGGLETLTELASGLAGDFAVAILIALHTSVRSPRMLPAVVGWRTPLPVKYAAQGGNILPGHVLFATPALHMAVIGEGFVGLQAGERARTCGSPPTSCSGPPRRFMARA